MVVSVMFTTFGLIRVLDWGRRRYVGMYSRPKWRVCNIFGVSLSTFNPSKTTIWKRLPLRHPNPPNVCNRGGGGSGLASARAPASQNAKEKRAKESSRNVQNGLQSLKKKYCIEVNAFNDNLKSLGSCSFSLLGALKALQSVGRGRVSLARVSLALRMLSRAAKPIVASQP